MHGEEAVTCEIYLKSNANEGTATSFMLSFLRDNWQNLPLNAKIDDLPNNCKRNDVEFIRLWAVNSSTKHISSLESINKFYCVRLIETLSTELIDCDGGDSSTVSSTNRRLPCRGFDGLWESLYFSSNIKQRLLNFCSVSVNLAKKGVDPTIVSCNRLVLLHGPPGTGKTTICKAIAQKLSILMQDAYPYTHFVEVNCHSLFSKWFSESGKLVANLFATIRSYVENPEVLVIVLIDEVESLTAARQASINSNEPSDAIRVVNAVLTQLDTLRFFPNVLVFATSNLTESIDPAFSDRADIIQFVGLPTLSDLEQILLSCLRELERVEMFPLRSLSTDLELVNMVVSLCRGLSGRAVRKLPILALAQLGVTTCEPREFMDLLMDAAKRLRNELQVLQSKGAHSLNLVENGCDSVLIY